MPKDKGVQTHEDIPEIPEGVEIPDSEGSLIPDVEEPEPIEYPEVSPMDEEA